MDPQTVVTLLGILAGALVLGWILHKIGKALVGAIEVAAAMILPLIAAYFLVKWLVKAVIWCVRHPRTTLAVLVLAGGLEWLGWVPMAATAGALLIGAGLWWRLDRDGFERLVLPRVRAWWLRWTLYAPRLPRWIAQCGVVPEGMAKQPVQQRGTKIGVTGARGLVASVLTGRSRRGPKVRAARVLRVESGPAWDRVHLRIGEGTTPEQLDAIARPLASNRNVARCQVRELAPQVVSIDFQRRDILAVPREVPALEVIQAQAERLDLSAVPIGRDEYGEEVTEDVSDLSAVFGGESGSGKSSPMWTPIVRTAPLIKRGLVRWHGVDPKCMELAIASGLFDRYTNHAEGAVELLRWLVYTVMRERMAEGIGVYRKFPISTAHPLHVLNYDELLSHTRYATGRVAKRLAEEITTLAGIACTQGRALGVTTRYYVQDGAKEGLPFRDVIPRRGAMRSRTESQVDMILGDGAYQAGAWATRIATDHQGEMYVWGEGVREPRRLRYDYTPDHVLKATEAWVHDGAAVPRPTMPPLPELDPLPSEDGATDTTPRKGRRRAASVPAAVEAA